MGPFVLQFARRFRRLHTQCTLLIIFILAGFNLVGQDTSSLSKELYRPNIIKFNVTSNILWGPAAIFSYERLLKNNRSFSVEAGLVNFPSLNLPLPGKILSVSEPRGAGFKIDADYRFYLKKENKFQAPRGVYLAPYIAYYGFFNERDFTSADSSFASGAVVLNTNIHSFQLGGEMGYQFILFKDRMAIDFILAGPAIAYYTANLSLDGDFDVDQEHEYLQDLLDLLVDGFPGLGNLLNNQEVSTSGVADLFYAGFRYSISVGYKF